MAIHIHVETNSLGKHVKRLIYTVIFYLATLLIGGVANIYMTEHEDGHYEMASKYGLNPTIDYIKRKVDYDTPHKTQHLDVIGAGITREQRVKRELSNHHIPNDLYPLYSIYKFNHGSADGNDFHALTNSKYESEIKRAMTIEPIVIIAQWLLLMSDSPFFVHSKTEIDRRGVLNSYEITYSGKF